MKDIKVSVVTVCYNAASGIENTILSVINQTYSRIEYLIIDGASKDNTSNIIKMYSDYINYFISEPDCGIYDAMNKGIRKASGDLIIFMNAGDTFVKNNVIEKVLELYNGESIIHGNILRCFNGYKERVSACTLSNPCILDFINQSFPHQASFIRLELFQKYGLYSTDYKLISDWKFFFECIILNHVDSKYINIDIAYFQMDGESTVNVELYLEERRMYLIKIYGKEIFGYMEELDSYRSSILLRMLYNIKMKLKRILGLKNIVLIKSVRNSLKNK